MNFLASMRRWNDANIAASSGPVLRHHLTHPRTLNQNLGAPALPSVCPPPELTSPAVVVAVLAEDAALGVGDRWRVTNAMPAGSWRYTGRPMGLVSCGRWAKDTYEWWMHREMQPVQACGGARKDGSAAAEGSAGCYYHAGQSPFSAAKTRIKSTSSIFRKWHSMLESKEVKWH